MNVLVEYKVDITIIRNRSKKGVKVEKILIGYERVGRVQVDITIIRNRSKKGIKVKKILIGSERVGRVQGGHHNNP
jgi:DNA-binding protein